MAYGYAAPVHQTPRTPSARLTCDGCNCETQAYAPRDGLRLCASCRDLYDAGEPSVEDYPLTGDGARAFNDAWVSWDLARRA